MLFNLESDSTYESEMIKVKSQGINYDDVCLSLKIRNAFYTLSKTCQLFILNAAVCKLC